MNGVDQGQIQGGSKGPLDPPPKIFNIPRSRYSNRAVTLIKQSQYLCSELFKDCYVLYQL